MRVLYSLKRCHLTSLLKKGGVPSIHPCLDLKENRNSKVLQVWLIIHPCFRTRLGHPWKSRGLNNFPAKKAVLKGIGEEVCETGKKQSPCLYITAEDISKHPVIKHNSWRPIKCFITIFFKGGGTVLIIPACHLLLIKRNSRKG